MSRIDRRAHRTKQFQAIGDGQAATVAVLVDRPAIDVLHDQIGHSLGRRAPVEQAGNVRMIQTGKQLALLIKSPQQRLPAAAVTDELDGHLLLELAVVADRPVHRTHPATADDLFQAVRADAIRRRRQFARAEQRVRRGNRETLPQRRGLDNVRPFGVRRQQRFDFGTQHCVCGTSFAQKIRPLICRQIQRCAE